MIFLSFVLTFLVFLGNVKDQVYIKQRYLTQVNKKHDNLENVLIYCQRRLILLYIAAVRCVSRFPNRNVLLLCGDIEKNPGPFDASKLSTLDDAMFGAQNGIKFLLFNACSIQNKYQDISNLLQQLDSEIIVIVTLWLELGNPLTAKFLINISYCPHQSLGDFFSDELSAEVSNAFSATDNILLFGDSNIDMLSANGKKTLRTLRRD